MRPAVVYRIVELECAHPLALVPWDTPDELLPDYGPWTKAAYAENMVCLVCDAWRKVIGDLPRIINQTDSAGGQ
jgi:hypothetical protein